jgi:SNF2 family DNA or RNA helicase
MVLNIDFRKIEKLPENLRISNRIQSPVLLINRKSQNINLKLAAKLVSGGKIRYVEAPSLSHNWIIDKSTIKPLPIDINILIDRIINEIDPDDLTLPEVLRIQREHKESIPIIVHDSVFQTANDSAKESYTIKEIPNLKATLYPYQLDGVSWMVQTLQRTSGVILADEMGLGKTMQIISLFLLEPPQLDSPALIVCPTTLIANWHREIERFAPTLTVLIHRGPNRTGIYKGLMRSQVVLTTYDTVVNDIAIFSAFEWSFVICDESQAIKNPSSKRRQVLASIPRKKSIPVTGTPVENSLIDLWSLCDFAIPGLLGTQSEFENSFSDQIDDAQNVSLITNPIILKRRVKDVADDLPERIDIDLPLELTPSLAQRYEEIRTETIEKYPTAGALVATGQLALFCAHPYLRSEDFERENWEDQVSLSMIQDHNLFTPKIEQTVNILAEAFTLKKKVLIFSNYNACGPIIKESIKPTIPIFWDSINGSTPQADRQTIVDMFSEFDGPGVLVLNPKAAGAGLNITAATVVIHFTQCWNPALEMQASARAHRRGQTEPVTIFRLFFENTVEEIMIERSKWKRELADTSVPISSREGEDLANALMISPLRGHK